MPSQPDPPLSFRDGGPADTAAIVALVESAYRGEPSREGWTTEADLLDGQRTDPEAVNELLGRPDSVLILARSGGELVGCCHLQRDGAGRAQFGMFAVRPALQGGGVGRAVLAEARRRAAAWSCGEMRLTVIRQRTDLIDWYARRGFTPTGETEPFPYGDDRFGRPRRDDLEFVVLSGPVAPDRGRTTVMTGTQGYNIELNNGVAIPQLGFGVFQIPPAETARAVTEALEVGYRHIDTAQMYGNEREVGEAVTRSGLGRESVFITSKLNNNNLTYDDALRAFDQTLTRLASDYVDLFLIHWPLPTVRDFIDVWRALETVHAEGRARSIGVSNFQESHLRRLMAESDVVPAVNQIEAHPYLTQEPLRRFGEAAGIATEAWSPIAQGKVLSDPTIVEVAERVGRTPAQVVLRWHLQLGNIVFPKSAHPDRIRENFELFDFNLADNDMAEVSALNRDERTGPDPDTFDYVPG